MSDPSLASAAPAHLLCVVAARPNLMKNGAHPGRLARQAPTVRVTLLHTANTTMRP